MLVLAVVVRGGDPAPFDRIRATRLAWERVRHLVELAVADDPCGVRVGVQRGKIRSTPLDRSPELIDNDAQRPFDQDWMALQPVADVMATRPGG